MGVGEDFATFCANLAVKDRGTISDRYELITRRLNIEFWKTDSRTNHSIYTGSYGRGTATGRTSDVDMLAWLPSDLYTRYDSYSGNGQSALLQDVRAAISKTYAYTDIGADGQVVAVPFTDGITFEVLPAFVRTDGSFMFPDSNSGGSWRVTDPRPEIAAIQERDSATNGNLKELCRMARAWKEQCAVPIGGLLIDTLAYSFIGDWTYRDKSYLYYDWLSRDFFEYLAGQSAEQRYWLSPGARQQVYRTGTFEHKAVRARNLAKEAIAYQSSDHSWSARQKWREIYGAAFPE